MRWIQLTDLAQLDELDAASGTRPVLLFKHSTRCSISRAAMSRLEREWSSTDDSSITAYFLDLLNFRSISNAIAERYAIEHESPQALIVDQGKCLQATAHFGIDYADVKKVLSIRSGR